MPYGTLDFDLSDDERRTVRERQPLIVTANDRASDFVTVSRAGDDVPPVKRRSSTPSTSLRYLIGCLCCLVCSGLIAGIIFAAMHSSSSNNETTTTTTMAMSTAPTAAPATPSPTLAVSNGDGVDIGSDDVPPTVALTFLCNHRFEEGERAGRCMAIFSVDNPSDDLVEVPVGANNFVEPGDANRGQPTTFAVGARFGGAAFEWNCSEHFAARWTLRTGGGTSVATSPRTHVECPAVPHPNDATK